MVDEPLRTSVAAELGSAAELLRAVAAPDAAPLPAGTRIGEHFELESLLGRGGMGVVYRARDRRLDRKVALKLDLRGADLARARREATALARLAHPNVVTIYEIGEHDGAPFVAMELCGGGSVRAWLAAAPRAWRDILDVFVAAGRGLAAAHAAGLVHRDVKPDNLLLGDDGRPRIADFGLARAAGGSDGGRLDDDALAHDTTVAGGLGLAATVPSPAAPLAATPVGDRLTVTGAVVGTPRYMAPEQFSEGVLDARVDQFAFAVALYEALAGVDPFPGPLDQRLRAIEAGRLAAPRHAVPRRVLAPLTRALAHDASARWPSLDALVARLVAAARPRWPFVAVGVGALTAAAATIWIGRATADRPASKRAAEACGGLPLDASTHWNPAARAAFIAGNPAAPAAARLLADHLDLTAADWVEARRRLCVELPRRSTWSERFGDVGRMCLMSRLVDLSTFAGLRGRPASTLTSMIKVSAPPLGCADPARTIETDHDAAGDHAVRVHTQVQRTLDAGHVTEAIEVARANLAALDAGAGPFTHGMAEYDVGHALAAAGDVAAAEPPLRRAFFALRSVNAPVAYDVACDLAQLLINAGKADLGDEWVSYALAEADRLRLDLHAGAQLALLRSRVLALRGDVGGALAALEHELARLHGCTTPRCRLTSLDVQASRALYLIDAGRKAEALAAAKVVLAARTELFGDNSELLDDLATVGTIELELDQLDEGLATLTRARDIATAHVPHDAPLYAYAVWNYALAVGRREPRQARPLFDEALAIIERAEGAGSTDAAELRADRERWSRR